MGVLERILGRRKRARREKARRVTGLGRAALVRGDVDEAAARLREALLELPDEPELLALGADVARARRHDRALRDLFTRAADAPDDLQRMFELGSHLLTMEEPQLACVFLERALSFAPFDAVIRSELAIAQARAGRPQDVVETLALHPCLADDPGALFEFGWASLLTGDADAADGALGELGRDGVTSELSRKLEYALRRAAVPPASQPPDARDFLFLEHGSVLLEPAPEDGGRWARYATDVEHVGRILAAAAYVVRLLVPRPRRIFAADASANPLAGALARAVDGELQPIGAGRVPSGVLVARRAVDFESVSDRLDAPEGEILTFALALDWSRGVARVPDLVGVLARELDESDPPDSPEAAGDPAADLVRFVEERRKHLPPRGRRVVAAYVPDAPLPWV